MKKPLHEQIEQRRLSLKKSKYSIAKEVEQSQQNIGLFLKGEGNPTLKRVQAIIKSLGGELTIVWDNPKTTIPLLNKAKNGKK